MLIDDVETAKEAWDRLKRHHRQSEFVAIVSLKRELFRTEMQSEESVTDYITRVQQIIQQLRVIDVNIDDKEIAVMMLCGLPSSYDSVAATMTMDTLTSANVRDHILAEDRRRNERNSISDGQRMMFMQGKRANAGTHQAGKGNKENGKKNESKVLLPVLALRVIRSIQDAWIVDSGTTQHVCYQRDLFTNEHVKIGDNTKIEAFGIGDIEVSMRLANGEDVTFATTNVPHVPTLAAEKEAGTEIKAFRSDRGTEFVNNAVAKVLQERGIQHQTTTSYTPESNGAAERANRSILEIVRTLLEQSQVPKELWTEAVRTATLPSSMLAINSVLEIQGAKHQVDLRGGIKQRVLDNPNDPFNSVRLRTIGTLRVIQNFPPKYEERDVLSFTVAIDHSGREPLILATKEPMILTATLS
ncbi:uncharacterized protein VTP21DRAFT_9063 [Calcarisporiella thermophila]|uniref:uncharacterized protein n=1 Tax=Calcarisporiella thermophila TaxID=911321 RepID=UPI00374419A6